MKDGVRRHCLPLAICVVTVKTLGRAIVTVSVTTRLVMSNVAFSPSFMVMIPSSHPVVYFLSAGDRRRVAVVDVAIFRRVLPMQDLM